MTGQTYRETVKVDPAGESHGGWMEVVAYPAGGYRGRYTVTVAGVRLGPVGTPVEHDGRTIGTVVKHDRTGLWEWMPVAGIPTPELGVLLPSLRLTLHEAAQAYLDALVAARQVPYPCWACGAPLTDEQDQAGTHEHVLPTPATRPRLDAVMTAEDFTAWAAGQVQAEASYTETQGQDLTLAGYLADLRTRLERIATADL